MIRLRIVREDKQELHKPIVNSWAEAGIIHPSSKSLLAQYHIFKYDNYKLLETEQYYVKLCSLNGCYNMATDLFCKRHLTGDKNSTTFCQADELCFSASNFNFSDKDYPKFCSKHKLDGMVDVNHKSCLEDNCETRPYYNFPSEKIALYCSKHKKQGMINITHKKCFVDNCQTLPNYNFPSEKIALYCQKHKIEGMIDIRSKKCIKDNCQTIPNFNFPDQKSALYCFKHKEDGMINIISRKCIEDNCQTLPNYNYNGLKIALYCVKHKKAGMIDINSKRCFEDGCQTMANYNFEGEKITLYCSKHRKEGMIDIKNRKCQEENCQTIPNYNFPSEKIALYCSKHKKDRMIDIKHTRCKTYLCDTIVSKKYEGYCYFCYIHLFPDKPTIKNYKTKERAVVEYIQHTFPEITIITDKKIEGGCSRRRPDVLIDLGYQIIIVEIDENQHQDYDCSCENKRLMEISQDLGHRPIIFIRFNPDDYIIKDKKITGCWGIDKNGLCHIKRNKKEEWNQRLNSVKEQIEYWTKPENKTDKLLEVISLYFNED